MKLSDITDLKHTGRLPNVFVLGVGHSGTSIISHMLFELGYRRNSCDSLYCEDVAFRGFHERLLAPDSSLDQGCGHPEAALLRECESFLHSLEKPFVLKDPRFVLFAHLWGDLALSVDPNTVLLRITRNLEDVAESYLARGEVVRGEPGAYGRTLAELVRVSDEQFERWPGPKLSFSYEGVRSAIASFGLSAGVRHMGGGLWERPSTGSRSCGSLAALDREGDQAPSLNEDALVADAIRSAQRISGLERESDRTERHLKDMRDFNEHLRADLAKASETLESLENQLSAANAALAKSQGETAVLTESLLGLGRETSALKEHAAATAVDLQSAKGELAKWQSECIASTTTLRSVMQTNQELRSRLEDTEVLKARMALLKADHELSNGLLAWYRSKEASWSTESARLKEEVAAAHLSRRRWEEDKKIVSELYAQLTAYRPSRLKGVASHFRNGDVLWESVSPAFYEIKSYTEQHFRRSSRARLVLGVDLAAISYREYVIPFDLDRLTKVSLAIRPLQYTTEGAVGVEIVSSEPRVVTQVSVPLRDVRHDVATEFILPLCVCDLTKSWSLRVFVRDATAPVALWELMMYSALRARIDYMPFVLLG